MHVLPLQSTCREVTVDEGVMEGDGERTVVFTGEMEDERGSRFGKNRTN
jgi:hypothetical protein